MRRMIRSGLRLERGRHFSLASKLRSVPTAWYSRRSAGDGPWPRDVATSPDWRCRRLKRGVTHPRSRVAAITDDGPKRMRRGRPLQERSRSAGASWFQEWRECCHNLVTQPTRPLLSRCSPPAMPQALQRSIDDESLLDLLEREHLCAPEQEAGTARPRSDAEHCAVASAGEPAASVPSTRVDSAQARRAVRPLSRVLLPAMLTPCALASQSRIVGRT